MPDPETMIRHLYESFNQRNIPAVLAVLDANIRWANGQDGGHIHGHDAIRTYWTRQWAALHPQVIPLAITVRDPQTCVVEVHQIVHDLDGNLLLDETIRHVFRLDHGRITNFDIENPGGLSSIPHD